MKKSDNLVEKWEKTVTGTSLKISSEKVLNLIFIKKCKLNPQYNTILAETKMCWWRYGVTRTIIHCWREDKFQIFWKAIWQLFTKAEYIHSYPMIQECHKVILKRNAYIWVLKDMQLCSMEALFVILCNCKPFKCLLTVKWINMCDIFT